MQDWFLCQNKTYDSSAIPASDLCVGVPQWKLPHPQPPILLPLTDLIPAWFHILRWSCGECASHKSRQVHFLCLQRVPHLNVTFNTSWALEKSSSIILQNIVYRMSQDKKKLVCLKKSWYVVILLNILFIQLVLVCFFVLFFLSNYWTFSFKERQKHWFVKAEWHGCTKIMK